MTTRDIDLEPTAPGVDAKSFWRTLGSRATGATVVTTVSSDGPRGFLGLSATHLTPDPPTILVSVDNKTTALAGVRSSGHFAVNYLPAAALTVAEAFTSKSVRGADRFAVGEWQTLVSGAPVLKNALGAFDCSVKEIIVRDSINIVIGHVLAASVADGVPLIYFRGQLHQGVGKSI
jgi:flavin reductase (DIM6/NTAB) family NADH-FMN oxidoreductase RutF